MPKCFHCPHASTGKTCPALTRPAPRFCELVDPCHPHHKTGILDVLLDAPDVVEEAEASALADRRRDVLLEAYLTSWQGYGQQAEWTGRGLEALGHPVDFIDAGTQHDYIGRQSWVEDRIVPAATDHPWRMILAVPHHPTPSTPTVRFTMWETSRIYPAGTEQLNRAQLVIVPSAQNVECMRDSGVLPPVEVCPLGIDPAVYFEDGSRPRTDRIVFGMAGRMAHGGVRKGLNEGMRAFVEAFPATVKDVELQVKVFEDCLPRLDVPDDPRIKIITRALTSAEMADWYRGISVLFVPSKGEGWGFHTHQAMACGRPVIAAPWSGTVEFWDPSCGWSLDFDMAPAGEFYAMPDAQWAVPRHASMVDVLRRVHRDRDQLAARGQLAAAKAAPFTWDRYARTLRGILQRHGYLPASTADRLALVAQCPDRGSVLPVSQQPACGCAELTECRRGRGKRPGSVTLAECRACVLP